MLRQYPSYSHSSILRLLLKVTLSQPMETGGVGAGASPLDPGCRKHASQEGRALKAPIQKATLNLQLLWTRKLVGKTQSGNWFPHHRKLLWNGFLGTLGSTLGHTFIPTQMLNFDNQLPLDCIKTDSLTSPSRMANIFYFYLFLFFIFSYLTSCFYSVACASCLVYFRLL